MKISHAAVHKLLKSQGVKGATIETTDAELAPSHELDALVDKLRSTYDRRSAQKQGDFHESRESYPFSAMFDDYSENKVTFLEFTKRAINHLKAVSENVILALGGYIFFAEYKEHGNTFLFVAKLTESAGEAFDFKTAQVMRTTHLTTDKLQQAARLNVNGYNAKKPNYLNFVNAREDKEASDYFVAFIGCNVHTTARQETKNLVAVVRAFTKHQELSPEDADALGRRVHNYVTQQMKAQAPVSLIALANAAWPDAPEVFTTYLNGQDVRPGDEFRPTRGPLQDLIRYYYATEGFSVNLTREFARKHMTLNGNTLTIRNLPDDAKNHLTDSDE